MAQEWTLKVHEAAGENRDKTQRIYYKLPEQLERHHKSWVQRRGENATLSMTTHMRSPITNILNNPSRQAQVLPAIQFPNPLPTKKSMPSLKQKGKQKAVEEEVDYMDVDMGL